MMRRSQAPSLRGRSAITAKATNNQFGGISKSFNETKQPGKNKNIESTFRSTNNILELLTTNSSSRESPMTVEPTSQNIAAAPLIVTEGPASKRIFSIVFGKRSTKKHKSWEGDGVLYLNGSSCIAKNNQGYSLGSTRLPKDKLVESGTRLFFGDNEVEIIDEITESEAAAMIITPESSKKIALHDGRDENVPSAQNKYLTLSSVSTTRSDDITETCSQHESVADGMYTIVYAKASTRKHKKWEGDGILYIGETLCTAKDEKGKVIGTIKRSQCKILEGGSRLSLGGKEVELVDKISVDELQKLQNNCDAESQPAPAVKKFKPLLIKKFMNPKLGASTVVINDSDGFKLPDPSDDHQWNSGSSVTPVVVEPFLSKLLRPHQRKGVTFLYECIMGYRNRSISGAILADEMGLGKTLQCIALIWTLLRQGPYGKPGARSVLIVTPSSLTDNWAAEFRKWLGDVRLTPYVVNGKQKASSRGAHQPVVIVSYEMLVRHIQHIGDGFDLLICDEAHRLKNADTKVSHALNELCISMRILLTGTPIQNDLQEFFALADFTNPNCLGTHAQFRRQFEEPILAARQPGASEEVRKIGEERAMELNELTSAFLLRRTQSVLDSYLPGKREVVVFCKSSAVQRDVYNSVLEGLEWTAVGFDSACHLGVISALRKVANHPALLTKENDESESPLGSQVEANKCDQEDASLEDSGKLSVVTSLSEQLWVTSPRERVVIVSAFTQTLDMIEEVCQMYNYPTLRLDGSTPSAQRIDIVNRFNKDSNQFIFLLSAKAGGVGLNLIGASRLVLYDSDWNPATDLQAMARIWRDGQRRHVYIYRLLTTGTIEEKIFQRQLSKQTLAGGIVDCMPTNSVLLSRDELKDIFLPCEDIEDCLTHSSLGCSCSGTGEIPLPSDIKENTRPCQVQSGNTSQASTFRIEELMSWQHYSKPFSDEILDVLKLSQSKDVISFMFCTSC